MKLNQALKEKKRLLQKINEAYARFHSSNSIEDNETRAYDPEEQFTLFNELTKDLIELKSKIAKANQPIQERIFQLGEYKNIINRLRSVDTTEGKKLMSRNSSNGPNYIEYKCWMGITNRDNVIKDLEQKIESIQDEIDTFNATTSI